MSLLSLNDLPRFSPWPARLLGSDSWEVHYKSLKEIEREYDQEKWGPLLARLRKDSKIVSIEDVDRLVLSDMPGTLACFLDGGIKLVQPFDFSVLYLEFLENLLKRYLPASAFAEFGCGYGYIILNMARRQFFNGLPLIAADYVQSGVDLVKEIACRQGSAVTVDRCDLGSATITNLSIPEGAVIFTSFSATYVPQLREQFVNALSRLKPKAVIHFEPCYEHADSKTLFGLMKQRYIEVNDYNRNLVSLLHQQQSVGKIKILEELPDVIGHNALLPASVLVWRPLK